MIDLNIDIFITILNKIKYQFKKIYHIKYIITIKIIK